MTLDYDEYLPRAVGALAAIGARPIKQTLPGALRPPWTQDWDQMLILEEPGTSTLFAFTRGAERRILLARYDRLASGLATLVPPGRARLDVVAIPVFSNGPIPSGLAGMTPGTFYQGLRPTTWVADLGSGTVHAPGMRRRPEQELLERVTQADAEVPIATGLEAQRASLEHARRTQAFVGLMRGRRPVVTIALILANVAIFFWTQSIGALNSDAAITNVGAMVPQLVTQGQWWRLFSAMFLHAGYTHIFFNMLSLFYLGVLAERLYGSWRFLIIYIGAGVTGSLGSLAHAAISGQMSVPSVGASGAIFGVAGALITVRFQHSDVIPLRVRQQVSTSIIPLVALNLLFAALSPYIDNSAHVGGLIGGVLLSFLLPIGGRGPALHLPGRLARRAADDGRTLSQSGESPVAVGGQVDPNTINRRP